VAFFVSGKLGILDSVLSTATHFFLKKYKDSGFYVEKDDDSERGFNAL
ncbi:MAG: Lrp/AsnC family transcriptional regulator, partial [Oscillospiraceae bacterium]